MMAPRSTSTNISLYQMKFRSLSANLNSCEVDFKRFTSELKSRDEAINILENTKKDLRNETEEHVTKKYSLENTKKGLMNEIEEHCNEKYILQKNLHECEKKIALMVSNLDDRNKAFSYP